uniref:GDP-fucose protein O-fucosyltransferase 3 n=1 Tax=Xenopus laevis TaxID=8355 RepID=OFUT3_XENLA|nr:RecName: Full=Alpha-(1,3)-fucosyltransferase 10; AltName: Full=Fucosyltransferase X; Short=Fuc-TX; Short=FucT-X; AltName: Full=Galactoside 3-L-fucosyltransferase 10; Short=Fucosyltransferase 10 [Xenopus laevis]
MVNRIWEKRFWISCFFIIFLFILVIFQVMVELGRFEKKETKSSTVINIQKQKKPLLKEQSNSRLRHFKDNYPIMLWWSPLTGENGRLGQCGTDTCFFTINRTYLQDPMTKAILFYGTDFNIDSLPLPRKSSHEWALFHEESPKNNYKLFHEPAITLFNHTATFSRHSHMPLTSQYLEGLQALKSTDYLVSVEKKNVLRKRLSPLAYVQSDCDPPSDRDTYVQELMKYIAVDSYGECLHNKDLPQQVNNPSFMDDSQFHHILGQYKFILAFENAVCEDYITEKLWRPLKLGAVPVYFGAPNVEDWLPSNKSAIIVSRFSHPKDLAAYIKKLDKNDTLYMQFIEWKLHGNINNKRLVSAITERKWGVQDVTQDNYIDAFECMVCKRVCENVRLKEQGPSTKLWNADSAHLNCPAPEVFSFLPVHSPKSSMREMWKPSFEQSKKEAKALRTLVERNRNFTTVEFWNLVFKFW